MGGIIYGMSGVCEVFEIGCGWVVVWGWAEIQVVDNGWEIIVVIEIFYQVNKVNLVVKIVELVNDKKIIGISDIWDEFDWDGLCIVVDVKWDVMASVVLSMLYKYIVLQIFYGVNNVVLVNGRLELFNLKDIILEFIKF